MPLPPPRRPLPVPAPDSNEPPRPLPPAGLPPEPPKTSGKMILKVIGFVFLIVLMLVAALWQTELPNDTKGDMERIRGYARLNPLPEDAKEITIVQPDQSPDGTLGVRFKASEQSIESWLDISPGTHGVKGEYMMGGVTRYTVPMDADDPDARASEVRWQRNEQAVWIAVSPASKSLLEKARQQ